VAKHDFDTVEMKKVLACRVGHMMLFKAQSLVPKALPLTLAFLAGSSAVKLVHSKILAQLPGLLIHSKFIGSI
jgi:hypothetical protein